MSLAPWTFLTGLIAIGLNPCSATGAAVHPSGVIERQERACTDIVAWDASDPHHLISIVVGIVVFDRRDDIPSLGRRMGMLSRIESMLEGRWFRAILLSSLVFPLR